jgi:multiple sugar transport system permease protein
MAVTTTDVEAIEAAAGPPRRRRRARRVTRRDKIVLGLMVGIPVLLHVSLIWFPAVASVGLSFTRWDGIGGLKTIQWVGTENYHNIFTIYPPFWPAAKHNVQWLTFFLLLATPLGLFLAVLLDRELRGSRIYQSVFFLPVVLSLALIGFIWELIYSQDNGLIDNLFNVDVDWLGDPKINLWAMLVAASWRHVGYIMILYLAGLKSVDPSLREAAAIDGANEWQAFRSVIFPVLKPINIVVLVVTVIESLRAFDIVFVINRGRNGLELLSVLIYDNIVGEASRIGFGSAIAVILLIISLGFIIPYLAITFRKESKS